MTNNSQQEISMTKIIEVFTNEIRKMEVPRKNNDSKEKSEDNINGRNNLQENLKIGGPARVNNLLNCENYLIQALQQGTPKDSKINVKLPSINQKRTVFLYDKNKEIPRTANDLSKTQAKRTNVQQAQTEGKAKYGEPMDDLASKIMSIRPIRYELSPANNQDLVMNNLKSVKQKYTFRCDSHKQMPTGEERVKQQGRKLKTQGRRLNSDQKDWSLVKTQQITQKKHTKEIKSSKLGSISQTVKILPTKKQKYSINYLDFCMFISLLNGNFCLPTFSSSYRAFVGKGNNSILIKNTLKNRFWWNLAADSQEDANFYWSQSRDNKFIQELKSWAPTEGKNEQLKYKYFLERLKQQKEKDRNQIKQFTGQGLWKLMSDDERQKYSKNPYQAELIAQKGFIPLDSANKFKLHNHFEFNWNITNKKALYYNLKKFYLAIKTDPFQFIPLTFHVQTQGDAQWLSFQQFFKEKEAQIQKKGQGKVKKKKEKNLWIIKPGQNSNQGCGIKVAETLEEIKQIIHSKQNSPNGSKRSHIIQRYLMPLLYNKRKFDIRCYVLVTSINSILKAYWYEEGYIRTSSKEFTLKNLKNRFVHLTNDAVQKKSEDYGKYENGNKVSFADFQKYLELNYSEYSFYAKAYPRMIKLAGDSIRSVTSLLDSRNRQYTFEIFGLDFMIDDEFNTWLIEVNNNPCLELGCPLLARIIPNMIENAFKIAVDPLFPPPQQCPKNKMMASDLFELNKFTLIYNSQQQKEELGDYLLQVDPRNLSNIIQSDEQEDNHSDNPCQQLKQNDDAI